MSAADSAPPAGVPWMEPLRVLRAAHGPLTYEAVSSRRGIGQRDPQLTEARHAPAHKRRAVPSRRICHAAQIVQALTVVEELSLLRPMTNSPWSCSTRYPGRGFPISLSGKSFAAPEEPCRRNQRRDRGPLTGVARCRSRCAKGGPGFNLCLVHYAEAARAGQNLRAVGKAALGNADKGRGPAPGPRAPHLPASTKETRPHAGFHT